MTEARLAMTRGCLLHAEAIGRASTGAANGEVGFAAGV
jgi:hypothetical protein